MTNVHTSTVGAHQLSLFIPARTSLDTPVVWVLDANLQFATVVTVSMLALGRAEPLSVWALYPRLSCWSGWRFLLLTPTVDEEAIFPTGGAALFLRELHELVVPDIERRLCQVPHCSRRVLLGLSLAGMFAWFMLKHTPTLFAYFVVGSATSDWPNFDRKAGPGSVFS